MNVTSKEYLYSQLSQLAIFSYYFGEQISLDKKYKNPLRNDNNKGCNFYIGSSGDLLFHDPKEGVYDCFKFIMEKLNLKFYDALIRVIIDFNLIKNKENNIITLEKEHFLKKISIKKRDFSKEELLWWSLPDYNITQEILHKFGIYSVDSYWFNDSLRATNCKFTFAYKQDKPNQYQIYQPLAKKEYKFRTTNGKYLYGLASIDYKKDYVLINKSRKDAFYSKLLGYNSIGVIAEGTNIDTQILEDFGNKFEKVYICFDNDLVGVKNTNKITSQFPFIKPKYSLVGKDFTDMVKEKGKDWTLKNYIL